MRIVKITTAGWTSALLVALSTHAAGAATPEPVELGPAALAVTVQLEFAVEDVRGRPLLDLGMAEVVVTQERVRQKLTALTPKSQPGHYEARYVPTSGRGGPVVLQVLRPGARLRGTEGEKLKVRVVEPLSPLARELMEVLESRPDADDFPAHASVLRFEAADNGLHHTLAVEVPLASLKIKETNGVFAGHVQILTRVRDAEGRVLHRSDVDRTLTAPSMPQVQAQRLVWTGQMHLRPGSYTLDVVARDANGGGAVVRQILFDALAATPGVRLASVALLQPMGGQIVRDGARDDDDPLFFKGEALLPTLRLKTVAGPSSRVEFFTIFYPDRTSPDPLVVRLDLMRGDEMVGSTNVKIEAPDERGEVRYAGALPIRSLAPAEYHLRLSAQQGRTIAIEEAPFTVLSGNDLPALRLENQPVALDGAAPRRVPAAGTSGTARPDSEIESVKALLRRQRFEEALLRLKKMDKDAGGGRNDVRLLTAVAFLRMGAYKDAETSARELLAKSPGDGSLEAEAHMILARAAAQAESRPVRKDSERLIAADAAYRKVLELTQDKMENAHLERAEVLYRLERPDEARAALEVLLARTDVSDAGASRARLLKDNPRCATDACLPDLAFVTTDGRRVTAEELRGKVVLLSFWATWCGPCVAAVPELRRLHAKFEGEPFVMVGVNLDRNNEVMKEFMSKNDIRWAQLTESADQLETQLGVRGIPAELLFDHEGVFVTRTTGWSERSGPQLAAHLSSAIGKAKKAQKKTAAPGPTS